MPTQVAMAIAAHPDDIEFMMAGTLLLLKNAGYETHYMTVASGSCGSAQTNASQTRAVRRKESQNAAKILGAKFHPSLTDDLEIFYEMRSLRRLAAVLREVAPQILLIPSPHDYMEDHVNTSRLAVTAAFARGMPNFRTLPKRAPTSRQVTLYHAMPHKLCDQLRQTIVPGLFVNTASVHPIKCRALAAHQSQEQWLDFSQVKGVYRHGLEQMSLAVGRMSGRFKHAEGWRRHSHMGFCCEKANPLRDALGSACFVNRDYERGLG